MSSVIICYWQPGSGGDTVQRLLSLDPKFSTVIKCFNLEKSGRTVIEILPWFKDNFNHTPGRWYLRDWSHLDLEMIYNYSKFSTGRTLVIPTHRRDQAVWLKENIPNSKTIGICYPKNMYLFLLSRWCKKCAEGDLTIAEHYQDLIFQTLRNKKVFGAYVLKDQLRFSSSILQEVPAEWDVNLQLADLLLGNISTLKNIGLDITLADSILWTWINEQKMLYRQQWNISDNLKSALGYNDQAPVSTNLELNLDEYDTILIRHWLDQNQLPQPNCKLSTLSQADWYFKKIIIDNNVDN